MYKLELYNIFCLFLVSLTQHVLMISIHPMYIIFFAVKYSVWWLYHGLLIFSLIYWWIFRLFQCGIIKTSEAMNIILHVFSWTYEHISFFFNDLFIYSSETHRERGRDTGRGRSRLPAGSLMRSSILGPQDHNLSQRRTFNHWATQVPQNLFKMHLIALVIHRKTLENAYINVY